MKITSSAQVLLDSIQLPSAATIQLHFSMIAVQYCLPKLHEQSAKF